MARRTILISSLLLLAVGLRPSSAQPFVPPDPPLLLSLYDDIEEPPITTTLTIGQLTRELNALRELMAARQTGYLKAFDTLTVKVDQLPELIEKRVAHLQALHEERFRSLQTQSMESDTRIEQLARHHEIALTAALNAQKDNAAAQLAASALAINKSEAMTAKQLDQLSSFFQVGVSSINSKIEDVRARLTLIEGMRAGDATARDTSRASLGSILGILGFIVACISVVAAVVFNLIRKQS